MRVVKVVGCARRGNPLGVGCMYRRARRGSYPLAVGFVYRRLYQQQAQNHARCAETCAVTALCCHLYLEFRETRKRAKLATSGSEGTLSIVPLAYHSTVKCGGFKNHIARGSVHSTKTKFPVMRMRRSGLP